MSNYMIYFSPTKSTEKIVKIISKEFVVTNEIDLSKHDCKNDYSFGEKDLCIIGVPSYGGRVPSIALKRMEKFIGNNTKVILVVSYGNRAYDDTLKELQDFVKEKGFVCVGAVAAVAEHSIMHNFATNRPDDEDKLQLLDFSKQLKSRIGDEKHKIISLLGNYPYREYKGIPLKPHTTNKCTSCVLCAKLCPVGAISSENPRKLHKNECITCMRCITICPTKAKKLNSLLVQVASKQMEKTCTDRKHNEIFI